MTTAELSKLKKIIGDGKTYAEAAAIMNVKIGVIGYNCSKYKFGKNIVEHTRKKHIKAEITKRIFADPESVKAGNLNIQQEILNIIADTKTMQKMCKDRIEEKGTLSPRQQNSLMKINEYFISVLGSYVDFTDPLYEQMEVDLIVYFMEKYFPRLLPSDRTELMRELNEKKVKIFTQRNFGFAIRQGSISVDDGTTVEGAGAQEAVTRAIPEHSEISADSNGKPNEIVLA